jgi:hypothetical protein
MRPISNRRSSFRFLQAVDQSYELANVHGRYRPRSRNWQDGSTRRTKRNVARAVLAVFNPVAIGKRLDVVNAPIAGIVAHPFEELLDLRH